MDDSMKQFRNQTSKRYIPGLDGLRALSVLAVIAYHLNGKWAQGGLLGVGIFFVISGYLITDQIVTEWKQFQKLRLLHFWVRRARRLLPVLICMLLFVASWVDPGRLFALKGDFLSSIFYVNNWWLIFHDISYFESYGPVSPIGHLWSLSIEEQFYLIWPLVLVIGIKMIPHRGKLTLWILAGAVVSALAMAMLYVPGTDPSRVYYGTDTRLFGPLVGAALAVIWPSQKLNYRVSKTTRLLLDSIGVVGVFMLLVLINDTNKFDDSLYRGGFLKLSFITAAVIAVLVHPASRVGNFIGCKPLRWIGVRSYSLYIWHFPIIVLSSSPVNTEGASILRIVLQLAASFIIAAISYKYIEQPFRRGIFGAKSGDGRQRSALCRRYIRPVFLVGLLLVCLIPISCSSMYAIKPGTETFTAEGELPPVQQEADNTTSLLSGEESMQFDTVVPSSGEEVIQSEMIDPSQGEADIQSDSAVPSTGKAEIPSGKGITVIGDSVILGVASYLENMLPGIVIDGKVGRQMSQAQEVINQLRAQGKLGDSIIIELGTNGPFNKDKFRIFLQSLSGEKQIMIVNTRVPREWQDIVNANLSEVANEFSNVKMIDWYSASEGKDDYFYQDGVHLKPEGAKYFASLLVESVTNTRR
ncbi:acyltransferase family protein [Brevibacillus laterosporus]|uniref:Acyltransferase family protein n=1 Tax=Brevibacillus laterosporus TaxID=1465 RepID=A0AAP3GE27_BRELA|nr:acyltransferase family protein [Brevibacillus laterosporus]MCR8982409.1 acetyltransferase [Brevibacillus laterosporus]MCZ0809564.1 acyltransferase family protein [Brevibacillus laterosporus]MCZ0828096.1 acyltransferase family protein [Brevibacillus laterosporus]MCZ0852105.1 acyltransferase family protein [Brevibacillus laterosporus]